MREGVQNYVAVIPAYNEAGTIHAVASQTLTYIDRIVIVDDGSADLTVECLSEVSVTVLRHPRNLGKGAALWRGMQYAMAKDATAVITLDGDGQHDPADIPALLSMHRRDSSAIVIGARLHARRTIPWLRYLANRVANFWISWAAGSRIPDSQSGFRLYPTTVLKAVGSRCDATSGFAFESELLIEAVDRSTDSDRPRLGYLWTTSQAKPLQAGAGRDSYYSHGGRQTAGQTARYLWIAQEPTTSQSNPESFRFLCLLGSSGRPSPTPNSLYCRGRDSRPYGESSRAGAHAGSRSI